MLHGCAWDLNGSVDPVDPQISAHIRMDPLVAGLPNLNSRPPTCCLPPPRFAPPFSPPPPLSTERLADVLWSIAAMEVARHGGRGGEQMEGG